MKFKIGDKKYDIIQGIKNRLLFRFGGIYRFYLLHINRGKLKKYLATRKGKCNNCGACCGDCKMLYEKDGKKFCKNFEIAKQIGCVLFPISPFEKKRLGLQDKCGFYWEKNDGG